MALLLYGITQSGSSVEVKSGVFELPVASQEIAGFRAYWTDLGGQEGALADPESVKQAAVHFHKVLRQVLTKITILPYRFPALIEHSDALAQHLIENQAEYAAALEKVGDAVQYEIVGSWSNEPGIDLATPVSGREYLERRQAEAQRIAAVESKLKAVTAGLVRSWRSKQERRNHRWYALVPRQSRESFLASLRTAGGSEGVKLRLSGPWPPSEFVTLRVAE